ncbi:MAG: 30S ribosomal protein S15 [Bacteroidota bacterium]
MHITREEKEQLFQTHSIQQSVQDTGSSESQIALATHRIRHITAHLKSHKKDKAARLGLIKLVGKRKRQLSYLQQQDLGRYRRIITSLGLRK